MHPAFDEAAMADDYQMLEELGSGSFGIVYKAIERSTGDLVAIKHIDLEGNDDDIREIQQEISLLSTCASDFVTQYKTSFVRGVKLWIVMEYLGGGSCLDLLKRGPFSEAQIAVVMRELLQGLDYLHTTGKIHRDIKAANVLLSNNGHVKLADFGVAAQLTNIKSQRMTFVGTPFWMAPEVIQEAGYDFRADIWSLGITAMELAQGEPPHSDVHPMKVLFLIPKQPPPRLEGPQWSRDFKDFIAACLNKDADRRPTAKALLKHRFIQRAGRVDVLRELVQKAHKLDSARERGEKTRYYEETLYVIRGPTTKFASSDTDNYDSRQLPSMEDEDDWVFDTVKPVARAPISKQPRKRLSRIPSDESSDIDPEAMERFALHSAPLLETLSMSNLNARPSSTIQTPQAQPYMNTQNRKPSALTARKISIATPNTRRKDRDSSVVTARRVSGQDQSVEPNISFGNGDSTVRQFRRVSSENGVQEAPSFLPQSASMPQLPGTPPDSDIENKPIVRPDKPAVTPALNSKEAILGRRAYTKALEPSLQECLAQTSDSSKRADLYRVAEAWTQLDSRDPEGTLLLLRAIFSRVQADPKLAAQLMPQHIVGRQLASLRLPKTPHKSSSPNNARNHVNSKPTDGPNSSPLKNRTPSSSGSLIANAPSSGNGPPSRAQQQEHHPQTQQPVTPQHQQQQLQQQRQERKRQQSRALAQVQESTSTAGSVGSRDKRHDTSILLGRVEPGLEHIAVLADGLYGKWCEGLQARWAMT